MVRSPGFVLSRLRVCGAVKHAGLQFYPIMGGPFRFGPAAGPGAGGGGLTGEPGCGDTLSRLRKVPGCDILSRLARESLCCAARVELHGSPSATLLVGCPPD